MKSLKNLLTESTLEDSVVNEGIFDKIRKRRRQKEAEHAAAIQRLEKIRKENRRVTLDQMEEIKKSIPALNKFLCDFLGINVDMDIILEIDEDFRSYVIGNSRKNIWDQLKCNVPFLDGWVENFIVWFQNGCYNETENIFELQVEFQLDFTTGNEWLPFYRESEDYGRLWYSFDTKKWSWHSIH